MWARGIRQLIGAVVICGAAGAMRGQAADTDLAVGEAAVVVSNSYGEDGYTGEISVGRIQGLEVSDGTLRLYYDSGAETSLIETQDLRAWTAPLALKMPEGMEQRIGVFHHNGWKGYGSGFDGLPGMQLFTSEDGVTFERVGWAFDWKMDTFYSMFWDPMAEEYRAYGRVRGNRPRDEGGWGPDNKIDRRGISLHANPTWSVDWEKQGQIVADPMDYWDHEGEIQPGFYVPNVFIDGEKYRAFPSVMFKDVNRVIRNYRLRGPDSTRLTGPVYPIEMESEDGVTFRIVSEESPVPLKRHKRFSRFQPPWYGEDNTEPTCADCYEVGQLYPFGRIIAFKDRRYIFYFYRDDTHYENPANETLERSIYVLRVAEDR